MSKKQIAFFASVLIAFVWFANGLFCKVLNLAPRHQQIVGSILGQEYAAIATKAIGLSEILMVLWIFSRIQPRLCATTQIVIVLLMNVIEFTLVPDLLLFGKLNIILACCFAAFVYWAEFVYRKKIVSTF
jgi:hypothetical protein